MRPEIITLLAVIVGAVVSFVSSLSIQAWLHHRERKSLQGALVGEISAILEIISRRKFIPNLQQVIARIEQGEVSTPFVATVTQEYFSVYKSNVSRLGLLRHPLPQKIATFYTQCFAILEDLKISPTPITSQERLMMLKELLGLFHSTTSLGEEIVKISA